MALTVKNLGNGQLPDSITSLYTVPAGMAAIVKNIRLVNTHSSSLTVNLFYLPSGGSTPRRILPKDLSVGAGQLVIEEHELTMGAGDQLQGTSQTENLIDYVISGVERDA